MTGDGWSRKWNLGLPFSYSASIASDPSGQFNCTKFEWRRADYDGTRSTMSAEFDAGHLRPTGSSHYEFRVFVPADLENFPVQIILSQMHGVPDFHLGETWRHPISEIRLENGRLNYTYRGIRDKVLKPDQNGNYSYTSAVNLDLGQPLYDAWNHFVIKEKRDPVGGNGSVHVIVNGRKVSKSDAHIGYNDVIGPFWKFGVYVPKVPREPRNVSLYFKEVRIRAMKWEP